MKALAMLGLRGAIKSKFDELQSIHVFQTEIAHGVVCSTLPFFFLQSQHFSVVKLVTNM
jgi:hypothetical protein